MIRLKSNAEVKKLRKAAIIVFETLEMLSHEIRPGVTLKRLDTLAEDFIRSKNAIPGFKGMYGFPATLCLSPNNMVVHGVPNNIELVESDILGVDCGTLLDGFYGDSARTYAVGEISDNRKKLLHVTQEALYKGIEQAKPGNRLRDIGHAIQSYVESFGYSVVREMVGHGIGRDLHEEPQVPNYGKAGTGILLKAGMTLAIEPMVNMGTKDIYTHKDGWAVLTKDGQDSAHFEHTIAITEDGPVILSHSDTTIFD
jgi:methionyl aminopeptidase